MYCGHSVDMDQRGECGMFQIDWNSFANYNQDARGIQFKLRISVGSYFKMSFYLVIRSHAISIVIPIIQAWRQSQFMMK